MKRTKKADAPPREKKPRKRRKRVYSSSLVKVSRISPLGVAGSIFVALTLTSAAVVGLVAFAWGFLDDRGVWEDLILTFGQNDEGIEAFIAEWLSRDRILLLVILTVAFFTVMATVLTLAVTGFYNSLSRATGGASVVFTQRKFVEEDAEGVEPTLDTEGTAFGTIARRDDTVGTSSDETLEVDDTEGTMTDSPDGRSPSS